MTWRRTVAILPGIGVSLMPKLICPLCWPAYAGLLSAVGLGFLVSARNLLFVTELFLIMAVAALAFRARRRRGYGPAVMGIAASTAVLLGKFYLESPATAYAAVFVLIAASVWNSWPVKETAACPQCVGHHRERSRSRNHGCP
jgi:mercuric ion transport protein